MSMVGGESDAGSGGGYNTCSAYAYIEANRLMHDAVLISADNERAMQSEIMRAPAITSGRTVAHG